MTKRDVGKKRDISAMIATANGTGHISVPSFAGAEG
jgi:hypothetical protein